VRAAINRESAAGRLVDRLIVAGTLIITLETMGELEDVLARPKLARYVPEPLWRRFIRRLAMAALVVPAEQVRACRDPADDRFLEAALAGSASVIVPDDKDLLDLDPWRGVRIVKPEAPLKHL